ncbi:DUF262 domain-containing protein [Aliarcobacter butzleri]|uniref:DUF262 domain-containing protein n=1 Tax=Aliarcobacter butzleri TaxID=28197 RepID=UPI00126042C6|nr:DUF262 domain-containing protein [Aliarcobacter butzleri]
MSYIDRIKPTDKGIITYLDDLKNSNYQIPTFQREVVWEKESVKKLWDSIYKFYPLGSILVWKTNVKLQNHRQIGGHKFNDNNFSRSEYQYLLDGQQRTTSLLTSLYGGQIEGKDNFDPSLYVDLTIQNDYETDDENYKKRFLYWDEINDKNGEYRRNTPNQKKFDDGLIIKLINIKEDFNNLQKIIIKHPDVNLNFDHPYIEELGRIKQVLDNYRISFIELKGIQISEVCQIFERINQAGKPLDIFDIVVAKTFRPSDNKNNGFYLRELLDKFKNDTKEIGNNSNFLNISDFDYLQIIAILIKENIVNSGIWNITPRYLNDIKTEQIEEIWESAKKAILKTFDFFENYLNIKIPQLVPYRYFYLTLTNYFYENREPDYNFLKKYFWFYSLHNEDLLSNTTDINEHINLMYKNINKEEYKFDRFLIDKESLRNATYSSKGVWSRAILSLYSSKRPKDWKNTDKDVISHNLFTLTDKPNLHHIFPLNYIQNNPGKNELNKDSLMNIAYLTQLTNLDISDKAPLKYLSEYDKNKNFESVLQTHLIPKNILNWIRDKDLPEDALDQFIELRVTAIINELKSILEDINFEVIDTKESN